MERCLACEATGINVEIKIRMSVCDARRRGSTPSDRLHAGDRAKGVCDFLQKLRDFHDFASISLAVAPPLAAYPPVPLGSLLSKESVFVVRPRPDDLPVQLPGLRPIDFWVELWLNRSSFQRGRGGEIGRRARLRIWFRKDYGFESRLRQVLET